MRQALPHRRAGGARGSPLGGEAVDPADQHRARAHQESLDRCAAMPKADDIETRFRTAGHFTDALKKNLFALFCQPIVPVESAKVDYKYLEIFVRFREEEDKLLPPRSEEHTSELQSPCNLVCRLLLEKKKKKSTRIKCINSVVNK